VFRPENFSGTNAARASEGGLRRFQRRGGRVRRDLPLMLPPEELPTSSPADLVVNHALAQPTNDPATMIDTSRGWRRERDASVLTEANRPSWDVQAIEAFPKPVAEPHRAPRRQQASELRGKQVRQRIRELGSVPVFEPKCHSLTGGRSFRLAVEQRGWLVSCRAVQAARRLELDL